MSLLAWPFGDLEMFGYDFLMVDPPWSFKNYSVKGERKGAKAQYGCMTLDQIKALPVGQLCRGPTMLMLWATNPMLDRAFEVMRAWGFTFKTAGHWVKRQRSGDGLAFGTGYILRCAGEPFLIGTVNGTPSGTSRSTRSVIEGAVREHSRKPDEAYEWAEKLMPHARRAELFARQVRPGWDCWGDQLGKFSGSPRSGSSINPSP